MSDLQVFLEGQKGMLKALLGDAEDSGREIRDQVALALDTSAQILADQLLGKDTSIAEASLNATRLNLQAAMSVAGYGVATNFIREALVKSAEVLASSLLRG